MSTNWRWWARHCLQDLETHQVNIQWGKVISAKENGILLERENGWGVATKFKCPLAHEHLRPKSAFFLSLFLHDIGRGCSSVVILSSYSQRHSAMSEDIFGCWEEVWLASSGQQPEMLLTILSCTRQPSRGKNNPGLSVSRARLEKLWYEETGNWDNTPCV